MRARPLDPAKFRQPDHTAQGEPRASVALVGLQTVWINTGTLCNITCENCYIESSPRNDRLAYITAREAAAFYDEIARLGLATREIAFTGGEPFMNPWMLAMAEDALKRGFEVLILTNAMQPMQRRRIKEGLLRVKRRFGGWLTIRASLDHFSRALHDAERGAGSFDVTIKGADWLARHGFRMTIAGRSCWGEDEAQARAGYARLFEARGWPVCADDPASLVIFPEMNARIDVPEITTACWDILGLAPSAVMCASSRMVVKRKGAHSPVVLPCTLLPYEEAFEMGATLEAALGADGGMFRAGAVKLCHPHCAKFCVLGGGSCSTGKA
jgi:hypothetical protein